jgi:hypothetical protein
MSRAGTIRILLLLSMCCACLYSQTLVSVMITPESGTFTANLFGKGKVGIWDCSLCNDSLVTVTIQPERVYMAAPALHRLDIARATTQLQSSFNRKPLPLIITTLGWAADGAVVFMGGSYIKASVKVMGEVGAGGAMARFVAGKLKGVTPQFSSLLPNLLDSVVVLTPGQCASRTILASLMKNPATIQATITIPQAAVIH